MAVTAKLLQIVETANTSETICRMMCGWNRIVHLSFDAAAHEIIITDGRATLRTEVSGKAELLFILDEKTLDDLLSQRMSPLTAKMQGRIKSSGNIIDILRFASILTTSIKELHGPAIAEKGR